MRHKFLFTKSWNSCRQNPIPFSNPLSPNPRPNRTEPKRTEQKRKLQKRNALGDRKSMAMCFPFCPHFVLSTILFQPFCSGGKSFDASRTQSERERGEGRHKKELQLVLFFYVQNEISVKMFLRWLWLSFHAVLHRRHAPKRLARLRPEKESEWANGR